MLKVYKVRHYVSIDGADWRKVVDSWFMNDRCQTSSEPPATEHILSDVSFDEAREYLWNNEIDGVFNIHSFWTDAPKKIGVRYSDAIDVVSYRYFNTMSYKTEYEEWADVSLDWVMKNLPADQTIQYLKERGITTCPMNF